MSYHQGERYMISALRKQGCTLGEVGRQLGRQSIERATHVPFYFATPHHAWERGTSENTSGLLRQYVPKGRNLAPLTQGHCDCLADHLNQRPRKRLGFRTPRNAAMTASQCCSSNLMSRALLAARRRHLPSRGPPAGLDSHAEALR